jgi:hypothetical protein
MRPETWTGGLLPICFERSNGASRFLRGHYPIDARLFDHGSAVVAQHRFESRHEPRT